MIDTHTAKVIDLSLEIFTGMPYYPGDPQPSVEQYKHVSTDGVSLKRLVLGTHSGTHVDAPAHFLLGARTVDMLHPLHACGYAKVVDASRSLQGNLVVSKADISRQDEDVLLIYTSCHRLNTRVGTFPTLSKNLAQKIVDAGYRCVGIDSPTIGGAEVHRTLLGSGVIIVENLSDRLAETLSQRPYFICLPLKVADGDGAPARALAIL